MFVMLMLFLIFTFMVPGEGAKGGLRGAVGLRGARNRGRYSLDRRPSYVDWTEEEG